MRRKIVPIAALLLAVFGLAFLWQHIFRERFLRIEYPVRYESYVEKYSAQYGVDPWLVYAVIKNESGFDAGARSNIGAMGLMQLTPDTFEWAQSLAGDSAKIDASRLYDPETNIKYGTLVLSALTGQFDLTETAVAAYHAGQGSVRKWLADPACSPDGRTLTHIPFANTRVYVGRVIRTEKIYRQLYGGNQK